MNSVNIIGRWVRDHEVVATNNGTTIVKNTIAVDHPFKKDDSSFLRVVMFNKTGELANQYTGKGSKVAIMGHIQTGSYEKDGQKVFTVDIIANQIEFLDSKKDSQQNQQPQYSAPQQTNDYQEQIEQDLPF